MAVAEAAAAAGAVAAVEAAEAAAGAVAVAVCHGERAAGASSEHFSGYVETQVLLAGLAGSIRSLSCLQRCPFGRMGSIAHDEYQRETLA